VKVVRGCRPIVVTLLVVAGFLSVVQAEQPAAAQPECDPAAVMNHRLDELGRSGYVSSRSKATGASRYRRTPGEDLAEGGV
jgi:hypothetical protein